MSDNVNRHFEAHETIAGPEPPGHDRSNEHEFVRRFLELLDSDKPQIRALFASIHRFRYQFKLHHLDTGDILNEVFLRGRRLTASSGVEIRNVPAWAKRTAFNYICEQARQNRRTVPEGEELLDATPDESHPDWLEQQVQSSDFARLNLALQKLDPSDAMILKLKIANNLSWIEIQEIFASEGRTTSVEALRKKKERALKRLRQLYHAIQDS